MSGIDISKFTTQKAVITTVNSASERKSFNAILTSDIKLFKKRFGDKEKERFYSELGLLLGTGVDIKTAFEIIEEDITVKEHQCLVCKIKECIIGGQLMYEAIDTNSNIFSAYESRSIKIGEETGRLPEVLKELGSYFESAVKLRRQIVGVLTYPVVVITMAILIVYFMLAFVVPIFSEVFTQTGRELPALTRSLIRISGYSSVIFYFVVVFILAICFIHKTYKKTSFYRSITSRLVLRIPVIGTLVIKIYLSRFCQSMKLLAGAKVVIVDALDLVKNMIGFYPMEHALQTVRLEVIAEGKLLHESLSRHEIFPKKLIAMIKLCEEVNEPELIFNKLHTQYTAEIEHQQAVLGKLIEPFFIIFLGLFVGLILVAMYLPMFEMSTVNY